VLWVLTLNTEHFQLGWGLPRNRPHSNFRGKDMNTLTKEQREAWDKITGPGLYKVFGGGGYQYLCNRIKWMVLNAGDPHTVLLIGTDEDRAGFLKVMIEEGALDGPGDIEPWFFAFED